MLGELNWIFTAITDTIAWNTLPRGNFIYFSFFSKIIIEKCIKQGNINSKSFVSRIIPKVI